MPEIIFQEPVTWKFPLWEPITPLCRQNITINHQRGANASFSQLPTQRHVFIPHRVLAWHTKHAEAKSLCSHETSCMFHAWLLPCWWCKDICFQMKRTVTEKQAQIQSIVGLIFFCWVLSAGIAAFGPLCWCFITWIISLLCALWSLTAPRAMWLETIVQWTFRVLYFQTHLSLIKKKRAVMQSI